MSPALLTEYPSCPLSSVPSITKPWVEIKSLRFISAFSDMSSDVSVGHDVSLLVGLNVGWGKTFELGSNVGLWVTLTVGIRVGDRLGGLTSNIGVKSISAITVLPSTKRSVSTLYWLLIKWLLTVILSPLEIIVITRPLSELRDICMSDWLTTPLILIKSTPLLSVIVSLPSPRAKR